MKQAQIISDPQILGGKPVIAGTRISVELILDRISSGMSVKEILKDYPHLTVNQVKAAISTEKVIRDCVVCGKRIVITLYPDKTYKGGHFFGKLNIGKGKKAEYWECNRCFTNNSNVS